MTPTFLGRIQTRFLLLLSLGLSITFFWSLFAGIWFFTLFAFFQPFLVLFFVLFAGIGWDLLFTLAQRLRWDRDWPPALQWLAGILEMIPAWLFAALIGVPWWLFLLHYWSVWLAVFVATQGPMRIIFPRWRYDGGQWL